MRLHQPTNAEMLGFSSALSDPRKEALNTLLGTTGTSCKVHLKRYVRYRSGTNARERGLLDLGTRPPEDILLTLVMDYAVIGPRGGRTGVGHTTAIGVFGEVGKNGPEATHVHVGTASKEGVVMTESLSTQLAYSHELVLPEWVIASAISKNWQLHDAYTGVEDWDQLADFIDTIDRSYSN